MYPNLNLPDCFQQLFPLPMGLHPICTNTRGKHGLELKFKEVEVEMGQSGPLFPCPHYVRWKRYMFTFPKLDTLWVKFRCIIQWILGNFFSCFPYAPSFQIDTSLKIPAICIKLKIQIWIKWSYEIAITTSRKIALIQTKLEAGSCRSCVCLHVSFNSSHSISSLIHDEQATISSPPCWNCADTHCMHLYSQTNCMLVGASIGLQEHWTGTRTLDDSSRSSHTFPFPYLWHAVNSANVVLSVLQ